MPQDRSEGGSRRPRRPFFHSLKTKFIAALVLLVGVALGLSAWWNLSRRRFRDPRRWFDLFWSAPRTR